MNVLFVLKSFAVGGVETVTIQLANKFKSEGHNVCIFALEQKSMLLNQYLMRGVDLHIGYGVNSSKENVEKLLDIIGNFAPNVIINQWGQNFYPLKLIRKVLTNRNIKVMTVLHCSPLMNGRMYSLTQKLWNNKNILNKYVVAIKLALIRFVSRCCLKYNYKNSDAFILLSESFVNDFKAFVHLDDNVKLCVIHNPITIPEQKNVDLDKKENLVLFVGRIDQNKNVQRVIDIWHLLENKYPDWKLRIVGDGEELGNVKELAASNKLKNVEFLGFTSPLDSYTKAKVLLLTSDFEGVPLVVLEAMNNGCVPIVYGSFSSIYDVIDSGEDGFVSLPKNGQFDRKAMVEQLESIISNKQKYKFMAEAAFRKSRLYGMDNVFKSWLNAIHKK